MMMLSVCSGKNLIIKFFTIFLNRSCEMLRKKYLLPAKNFYSYRNDLIQQQTDIEKLLTEQNIPEDLEEYDIETFGPIIQVDQLFIIKILLLGIL